VVSSGIDSVVLLAISGILTDGSVVSGVKISANGRPAFRVVVPGSERVDPRMLVDHVTVDYTDQLDAAQWRIEAPVAAIADAGKWMGQTHTAKPIG
jgi:hypothetical protein